MVRLLILFVAIVGVTSIGCGDSSTRATKSQEEIEKMKEKMMQQQQQMKQKMPAPQTPQQ